MGNSKSHKYPKSLIDYSHHFNQIDLDFISEKKCNGPGVTASWALREQSDDIMFPFDFTEIQLK